MFQSEMGSHYDLLEVPPGASAQEIRTAYQRLKNTYQKDNVAHYSLLEDCDSEQMLHKIDEAYRVLSDPGLRVRYDRELGLNPAHEISHSPQLSEEPVTITPPPAPSISPANRIIFSSPPPAPTPPSMGSARQEGPSGMELEISEQKDWSGAFIKRVREHRKLTLEELADQTRIKKTYISAIEAEEFAKLPAQVFVRGFLTQLAKALKVSHEILVSSYLARMTAKR